jgi:hypothetical protein
MWVRKQGTGTGWMAVFVDMGCEFTLQDDHGAALRTPGEVVFVSSVVSELAFSFAAAAAAAASLFS